MTKKIFTLLLFAVFQIGFLNAQTTVTGTLTDKESGEPLIGVNVLVDGTVSGTITDYDGKFKLTTKQALPFNLIVSLVGYESLTLNVTSNNQDFKETMGEQAILGAQVVVSASRVEEKILESPVTIEKLDLIGIQQSSSADYYDELTKLKGVHTNQSSLTFTSINTRGFASVGNTRFVQLMDGMDNSSALLNFPLGNIVGISELDIRNVELVPGAGSALYGPNAFNGVLLMNSKSPFEYQGLSAQLKFGQTSSQAELGTNNIGNLSLRYADQIGAKFAYKINLSISEATDWAANDYTTDRNGVGAQFGDENFDGLNKYGDETQIVLPLSVIKDPIAAAITPAFGGLLTTEQVSGLVGQMGIINMTRKGIDEEDLLESRGANSFKLSTALHYRLTEGLELSYNYRYGTGSGIYQGSERYALRGFAAQYHKVELKGTNLNLRAYASLIDDGDSYNLTALGAFTNETFSPTSTEWVPTYAGTYAATLIGAYLQSGGTLDIANMPDAAIQAAIESARGSADASTPTPGSPQFNAVVKNVRNGLFQKGGAGFIDNSNFYHYEGSYDFTSALNDAFGLQVGANYRKYSLFSDGTIFNEDPDNTGVNERIKIGEYGAYVQASKKVMDDKLKIQASIRYDKNENFDGQLSPRVSLVYSAGEKKQHNIRASFQTGFRNPTNQGQYIYFPTTSILLGGTKANAERYGIFGTDENGEGNSYSQSSFEAFQGALISGVDPATAAGLLQKKTIDYVKPEHLTAIEVGYKGLLTSKLLVDMNVYYNTYKDFIGQESVYNVRTTSHRGQELGSFNPVTGQKHILWRPYTNSKDDITSLGAAIGLTYKLAKGWDFNGNYSYADFNQPEESEFDAGFNTPNHRMNIGLSNRKIWKNVGAGISYKWQDKFYWSSTFGSGNVPAFSSMDAQISLTVPQMKSVIKLGGSNLLGKDYRTNIGAPFVGRILFVSLTYNAAKN